MSSIIQTIEDMEKMYYSKAGQALLTQDDLLSGIVQKDAPVLSTTTGAYNAVFGAQAWVQLNMEANTFGALPKMPWGRSGWRAITARSTTLPYGGVAENGAIPATVKPTIAELSTKPKTVASSFDVSETQEFLATQSNDDTFGAMSDLRVYFGSEHKENLNAMLNTENGTLASNNFESIDRVISSYAEVSNCKESDESTGYTANDCDIYSQDRDTEALWSDAYVSHNSSTVRSLTDSVIQTLVQNTLKNGANMQGQFFQTGYDTWATINQLYDPQVRYNLIGAVNVLPGVNGIQSMPGKDVGMSVASYLGRPLIESKDTVTDTGGISRLYLMDTSNPEGFDLPRLCIKIAKPTQYFEAGMNQGTPHMIDRFGTEGLYRTMGELICTFFKAQGKVRDLKA